jgi:hypothetical protein
VISAELSRVKTDRESDGVKFRPGLGSGAAQPRQQCDSRACSGNNASDFTPRIGTASELRDESLGICV